MTDQPPSSGSGGLPPVQYKGADLEAARGPGLGCFWIQLVLLGVFVVATPLSVNLGAPTWLSAAMLFGTIGLLLFAGQTVIFLLRLVAADRREGRRRPMAARTPTVGELEDATLRDSPSSDAPSSDAPSSDAPSPDSPSDLRPLPSEPDPPPHDPMRQ